MTDDEYDPGLDPYADDLEEDEPGWFGMAIIWIFMIIAVAIGLLTESWRRK